MIFYEEKTQSAAIRAAIEDRKWSGEERKALRIIAEYVEDYEKNQATMQTEEWIDNPIELPEPIYSNLVFHGKWVNGQDTYTTAGIKFMLEDAGTGWRIGKCYPDEEA